MYAGLPDSPFGDRNAVGAQERDLGLAISKESLLQSRHSDEGRQRVWLKPTFSPDMMSQGANLAF